VWPGPAAPTAGAGGPRTTAKLLLPDRRPQNTGGPGASTGPAHHPGRLCPGSGRSRAAGAWGTPGAATGGTAGPVAPGLGPPARAPGRSGPVGPAPAGPA